MHSATCAWESLLAYVSIREHFHSISALMHRHVACFCFQDISHAHCFEPAPLFAGGTSDPTVYIFFRGLKKSTSTKYQTLTPLWNEVHVAVYLPCCPPACAVHLHVLPECYMANA